MDKKVQLGCLLAALFFVNATNLHAETYDVTNSPCQKFIYSIAETTTVCSACYESLGPVTDGGNYTVDWGNRESRNGHSLTSVRYRYVYWNGTTWAATTNEADQMYSYTINDSNMVGENIQMTSGWDPSLLGTCEPEDPCQDEKDALIAQCGGNEKVEWSLWNDETCSGQCVCGEDYERYGDDCIYCPSHHMETFSGRCIPECPYGNGLPVGEIGYFMGYTCIPPECGEGEYLDTDNICQPNCGENRTLNTTTGECELACGAGYIEMEGDCVAECPEGTTMDPDNPNKCHANETEYIPTAGEVKADPSDAPEDKTTEADVTPNPNDPSGEQLDAIKKELSKTVEQNNDRAKQLTDINDNLKWIGDNARKTVDNLKTIGDYLANDFDDQIAAGVSDGIRNGLGDVTGVMGDVAGAVNGLAGEVDQIGDQIGSMAYEGDAPIEPTFDSEVGTDNDYTEYDDNISLAEQHASSDSQSIIAEFGIQESPISATLSGNGDPCLNGTICGKSVSACFDKPWMLTAYGAMKVILIAMGYVQTAILLNKAIIS